MIPYVLVFLGGGLGSICRFFIARLLPTGIGFPWGTLLANTLSCFILGALIGLRLKGSLPQQAQFLLMTGFCGGFSTFSTFSLEIIQAFESERIIQGLLYISISLITGLLTVFAGIRLFQ